MSSRHTIITLHFIPTHCIYHISYPPITPYIIYYVLPSHHSYIAFHSNTLYISHIISSNHAIFHISTIISYKFEHNIRIAYFDKLSDHVIEANFISFQYHHPHISERQLILRDCTLHCQ